MEGAGGKGTGKGGSADEDAPVDRIGSVDPIRDLRAMVARRDKDLLAPALGGMFRVVGRLARDPVQHGRAVDCLRAVRAVCLEEGSENEFNAALLAIRALAQAEADGTLSTCSASIAPSEGEFALPVSGSPDEHQAEAALHGMLCKAGITLIRRQESDMVADSEVSKAEAEAYMGEVRAGASHGGAPKAAADAVVEEEDEFADDDDDMD